MVVVVIILIRPRLMMAPILTNALLTLAAAPPVGGPVGVPRIFVDVVHFRVDQTVTTHHVMAARHHRRPSERAFSRRVLVVVVVVAVFERRVGDEERLIRFQGG